MQERNRGELAAVNLAGKDRTHSCSRFHFPSVVVRSSKIKVFGMATVWRGYTEQERRRVIKTLLDAGVESTRALSERSGLCKAPNETKKRQKRWESGKRQQLKPVLSWQHVQAHLTSNARSTQNFFKVGEVANTAIQAAALQRRFGRTGRCAVRFDEV